MTLEHIASVLDEHDVPYYVKDNHIYGDSMIIGTDPFEEVEDLTGYTVRQLYTWLGYC